MTMCQHGFEKCSICHAADGGLWPISETSFRFDLISHLHRQRAWSERTFGPGERTAATIDHITKELIEVRDRPDDLEEKIDIILLAADDALRRGFTPEQIVEALVAKQIKNEGRTWPDWRTAEPGKAIEHVRDDDPKHEAAK